MENNIQYTYAMIKPDVMEKGLAKEIFDIIKGNNFEIVKYDVSMLTPELVDKHYAHLLDKEFYPSLKAFMLSGLVTKIILRGDNAVLRFRELVGTTDSRKAKEGTIRNLFGEDNQRNAIHASDSIESAEEEIKRFFNTTPQTLENERNELSKAEYYKIKHKIKK